jgi:hypothetical protein
LTDREAACSCGQLRLNCRGEPVQVSMCHCLACQRRTGSAFAVQAWYRRTQIEPTGGRASQYERRGDSGRWVRFNFCPDCGGTVFWTAEFNPELIAVAVGTFADPAFAAPSRSGWQRRQHPWTTAIGGMDIERRD